MCLPKPYTLRVWEPRAAVTWSENAEGKQRIQFHLPQRRFASCSLCDYVAFVATECGLEIRVFHGGGRLTQTAGSSTLCPD